jgi:hypothetical protein
MAPSNCRKIRKGHLSLFHSRNSASVGEEDKEEKMLVYSIYGAVFVHVDALNE